MTKPRPAEAPPAVPPLTSSWRVVDQAMIDRFAAVTDDHQFVHVDPARARAETPFGGTIAHGLLTLSLISAMVAEVLPEMDGSRLVINYGFDKVRFLTPVRAGSRLRAHITPGDPSERPGGGRLLPLGVTMEIEGEEKPALVAEWVILV